MHDLRGLSRLPIVVAPMAGGASTVALVVAAGEAGAMGFLAAGYKSAPAVASEIDAVRAATDAAFGVNVFVPQRQRWTVPGIDSYLAEIAPDAERLGARVGAAAWDDDGWQSKLDVLLDRRPALVSFTFGCPTTEIVESFHSRGTMVVVTVTNRREASVASHAGADALCAQGIEAGAHRGSFANVDVSADDYTTLALVDAVRGVTRLPIIAAGGIGDPDQVAAALSAGATAVQCGTAFLRCDESGTHPVHRAALVDPRFAETAFTRAFSGRPARGLVNAFMREHAHAPPAYPQINNATRALRAAAAAADDPDRMSLWAGTGFRSAAQGPAGDVIGRLSRGVPSPRGRSGTPRGG